MDLTKGILIPQSYILANLLELYSFYTARMSKHILRCGPGVHWTVQKVPVHWYHLI